MPYKKITKVNINLYLSFFKDFKTIPEQIST